MCGRLTSHAKCCRTSDSSHIEDFEANVSERVVNSSIVDEGQSVRFHVKSTLNELLTGSQEVARISQHLVDGRNRPSTPAEQSPDKNGEERESTRCNTGQHGTPSTQPRCAGASLQQLGHITHFRCRQTQPKEPCLRRQPTLGNASLFDVLQPGSTHRSQPHCVALLHPPLSTGRPGSCRLCSLEEGQSVNDDLEPPSVELVHNTTYRQARAMSGVGDAGQRKTRHRELAAPSERSDSSGN